MWKFTGTQSERRVLLWGSARFYMVRAAKRQKPSAAAESSVGRGRVLFMEDAALDHEDQTVIMVTPRSSKVWSVSGLASLPVMIRSMSSKRQMLTKAIRSNLEWSQRTIFS